MKRSTYIREKTRVKDITQVIKQQWRWVGHVAWVNDNRWTKRLTGICITINEVEKA